LSWPEAPPRPADGTRRVPQAEDQVLHLERAEVLVVDGGDRVRGDDVRVVHELLDVVDRRDGRPASSNAVSTSSRSRAAIHFCTGAVEHLGAAAALPGRGEPRLLDQVRPPDQAHHPLGDRGGAGEIATQRPSRVT
jgi:hypothetical protein